MRGVTGTLELPKGVGVLWPILAAGAWVHIGKGTVFGLGHTETALLQQPAGPKAEPLKTVQRLM